MEIQEKGTTNVKIESLDKRTFSTTVLTNLGTCILPSAEIGTVFASSKFCAAYAVKGGNVRAMLIKSNINTLLMGHSMPIIDICFAPGEQKQLGFATLATLSSDGVCKIWEIANQEAGSELDTREVVSMRTKGNTAQRVIFHPGYTSGNHLLFILHGNLASGVLINKEFREDAVDLTSNIIERSSSVRLSRDSKVLDMSFYQVNEGHFKCATSHEDGTVCLWNLFSSPLPTVIGNDDDGASTVSMESSAVSPPRSHSRTSIAHEPTPQCIKVSKSPVLTVGFINSLTILVGTSKNCEISLWSSEAPSHPIQTINLNKNSSSVRSFRSAFLQRNVDQASCLALFDSRSNDAVILQIPKGISIKHAFALKVSHPILSVTGEYDSDRDKLLYHFVDSESIGEIELNSETGFGSSTSQEVKLLLRRVSKRASKSSLKSEVGSKQAPCCVIS